MTTNPAWPVEIAAVGPVAVGTMLWRRLGQLRFTVIVKASFAFAPGGVMAPIQPAQVQRAEVHVGNNPMRSVLAASDLSPFLDKADVLFAGHAHAPRGVPAPVLPVRLSIRRDQWTLLDKSLLVFGDRAPARPGQPPPEPAPFQRMPIVYERSFGGIGTSDNPLGVGAGFSEGDGMPNIVRPERGSRETAGFGPIPPYFPARKRLLKGYARSLLAGPVAELPADLDPAYFQAAPEDQRTVYLRGDELIALENLHPSFPNLVTRLPGARARARIYTPDGAEQHLHLEADTLFIEGDNERASLTFRASHPLTREHIVSGVAVLAGLELPAQAIAWPGVRELKGLCRPVTVPGLRPDGSGGSARATQRLEDASPLGAEVEDSLTEGLTRETVAPPDPAERRHDQDVTYDLDARGAANATRLQAPFAVAAPGSSRPDHAEPIPGAPWAPRKPLDTMVLIEIDAPSTQDDAVVVEDDLLVLVEEDEDQITGAFRAKSGSRAEEPRPPSAPLAEESRPPSAPRMEEPRPESAPRTAGPEEDGFDERAATRRMAPLKLPAPPMPFSAPAAAPPAPAPARPQVRSGLPFAPAPRLRVPAPRLPVPGPRPSAPAAATPPLVPVVATPALVPVVATPALVPAPRPSAPVATPALVPVPRPSAPAAATPPLVPVAATPPLAPAATTPPLVPAPPVAVETGVRAEVIARLRARAPLHGLDLAGADLHGIDFTGATLARLDLRGARLDHCTFTDARLNAVNLAGADLTGATLHAADLGAADLSRAVLTEARLDRATLTEANLSGARGERASFEGASGQRTSFARGTWDQAVFNGATFTSPDFSGALLSGASFRGASLNDARFEDARGAGVVFDGARMPGARVSGAVFSGGSFRDIDAPSSIWERATLEASSFQGARLREANFTRAICHRASFAAVDAPGASLQHLVADGADFQGANLEGAELRNAHMHGASFDRANLEKARAPKADLSRSRFEHANLSDAVLRSAGLAGASFKHARLDRTSFIEANLEQANLHGASLETAKMNGANLEGVTHAETADPAPDLQPKEQ